MSDTVTNLRAEMLSPFDRRFGSSFQRATHAALTRRPAALTRRSRTSVSATTTTTTLAVAICLFARLIRKDDFSAPDRLDRARILRPASATEAADCALGDALPDDGARSLLRFRLDEGWGHPGSSVSRGLPSPLKSSAQQMAGGFFWELRRTGGGLSQPAARNALRSRIGTQCGGRDHFRHLGAICRVADCPDAPPGQLAPELSASSVAPTWSAFVPLRRSPSAAAFR
jgi:hypothetical protein